LTFAEIYRDGGSFEARFETANGKGFGVWLQRSAMPDASGLHHRWLFAYEGVARSPDCVPVATGSDDERELLESLDGFLANAAGEMLADPAHLARLRRLVQHLRTREPCLPADIRARLWVK
jgi:hypothetical protein